jgi:hypothetical protein
MTVWYGSWDENNRVIRVLINFAMSFFPLSTIFYEFSLSSRTETEEDVKCIMFVLKIAPVASKQPANSDILTGHNQPKCTHKKDSVTSQHLTISIILNSRYK